MDNCFLSQKLFDLLKNINQNQSYGSSKLRAYQILIFKVNFFENGSEINGILTTQESHYILEFV